MKKLFKTLLCAVALIFGTTAAHAQLEDAQNSIGVNFGYAIGSNDFNNFGIGLKYNHHLSDALRLEFSGMYYFPSDNSDDVLKFADLDEMKSYKNASWIDASLNGQYLFEVGENMYFYPIFGLTTMIGHTDFKYELADGKKDKQKDNHFRFGANLGAGFQYNITDDFGVTLEAKYKLIKDFGNFNVMLGCVVLF